MSGPERVPQARWVKSRHSNPSGECVQLARFPDGNIAIRNSHYPDGLWLVFDRDTIRAFIHGSKASEFDHLVNETPINDLPRGDE